ncbi:MAG: 50S ribosomal protein L13 [Chloroflexota bacterium]
MNAKTYTARESEIERRWFVVDATGQTLGRIATQVARVLSGKNKPTYTAHLDTGDHVIILNASKVAVSRDKLSSKSYARHSGHPQGFKEESLGKLLERRPEEVLRRAVKGMMPHNRLGAQQLRKLKIYAGSDHPHQAQRPEPLA